MIWLVLFQYHIGRGHIGTTMKAKLYHLLEHRAKEWYFISSISIYFLCRFHVLTFSISSCQPIFCHSFVEGKRLYNNVRSRFDTNALSYHLQNSIILMNQMCFSSVCICTRWINQFMILFKFNSLSTLRPYLMPEASSVAGPKSATILM